MPIYEYQCRSCERRTEVMQRISDPPLTTCEECGGELKKLISPPAFQFKGSGWYVTDYAGKGKEAGDGAGKGKETGDAKTGDGKEAAGKETAKSDGGAGEKPAAKSESSAKSTGSEKST